MHHATSPDFLKAQRAYDNRCEPQTFAADEAAVEAAADQLWGTPSLLLDALAGMIDGAEMERTVDIDRLLSASVRDQVFDPAALTTAQLLVALLNATNPAQIVAVQVALRSRLDDVVLDSINDILGGH